MKSKIKIFRNIVFIILIGFIAMFSIISSSTTVNADEQNLTAYGRKIQMISLKNCFFSFNDSIKIDPSRKWGWGVEDIAKDTFTSHYVPGRWDYSERTCAKLLSEPSIMGVERYGYDPTGLNNFRDALVKLGYEADASSPYNECLYYEFTSTSSYARYKTPTICSRKDGNGINLVEPGAKGYGDEYSEIGDSENYIDFSYYNKSQTQFKAKYRYNIYLETDIDHDGEGWKDIPFPYFGSTTPEITLQDVLRIEPKGYIFGYTTPYVTSGAYDSYNNMQNTDACYGNRKSGIKTPVIYITKKGSEFAQRYKDYNDIVTEEAKKWGNKSGSGYRYFDTTKNVCEGDDPRYRFDRDKDIEPIDILIEIDDWTISNVMNAINSNFDYSSSTHSLSIEDNGNQWSVNGLPGEKVDKTVKNDFKKGNNSTTSLKNYFGDTNYKLTSEEGFSMYQSYISSALSGKLKPEAVMEGIADRDKYSSVKVVENGEFKNYYYWEDSDLMKSILSTYYLAIGQSATSYASSWSMKLYGDEIGRATLYDIIGLMNKACASGSDATCAYPIDVSKVEESSIETADYRYINDPSTDYTPDDGVTVEPDCYSGAGSLGWIVCPIIDGARDAIPKIYEDFIEPFLVLDATLFEHDATYEAWTQFQVIANILFAAAFLVVILSQLTGYGIDNYGIKKILPKLIVCAILINLSYIICRVAVDVANIFGAAIKSLFDGIGNVDPDSISISAGGRTAKSIGANVIILALVAALMAPAIISQGWGILVPIVLAAIGILIAVLSLFAILALRKAMAVVLVAISPLAFVAYMLPNTKELYKKWYTAFKAMLIAYPVCSLMVYGGQAVSRIMLATANGGTNLSFPLALSAAVMCIAPIFLIPGTIKKSMGAIGVMANALSNRFSHFAKNRAAETRGMRYLRQQGEQRAMARQGEFNNRRANATMERMNRRMSKRGRNLGDLSSTERRRYMNAVGMANAHDTEMQKAYALSFQNMSPGGIRETFDKMVSSGKYDSNLASAAIQKLSDANQHDVLNEMLQGMNSQFINNMGSTQRMALGNQLAGLKNSNVVAGLYGKSLSKGRNTDLETYIKDGANDGFAADVERAGKNIISSQDDSTLKYMANATYKLPEDVQGPEAPMRMSFGAEQMRNAIGNLDTKQQEQVDRLWGNMSNKAKEDVFSGMSAEQYAKVDEKLAQAVGGGKVYGDDGRLDVAKTQANFDAGRSMINNVTSAQREALNSEDGATIRASQNNSQKAMSDWSKATEQEKINLAAAHGFNTDIGAYTYDYQLSHPQHANETIEEYRTRIQKDYKADLEAAAKAEAAGAGYNNV